MEFDPLTVSTRPNKQELGIDYSGSGKVSRGFLMGRATPGLGARSRLCYTEEHTTDKGIITKGMGIVKGGITG